jgi:16S rRNA processing protein RimM
LSLPPAARPQWLQVARILRPRGNKGEVLAELLTDFPARLSSLKQIYLRKEEGQPQAFTLQDFWVDRNHPGMGIFHFAGYTTISDAETLRGYELLLPFEERVTLPAGQYFVTDLIGCLVYRVAAQSHPLGTVADVFLPGERTAGTPLLRVETPRGELLVPLAEDICPSIDVAARRIEVNLPEGLDDLNS